MSAASEQGPSRIGAFARAAITGPVQSDSRIGWSPFARPSKPYRTELYESFVLTLAHRAPRVLRPFAAVRGPSGIGLRADEDVVLSADRDDGDRASRSFRHWGVGNATYRIMSYSE